MDPISLIFGFAVGLVAGYLIKMLAGHNKPQAAAVASAAKTAEGKVETAVKDAVAKL